MANKNKHLEYKPPEEYNNIIKYIGIFKDGERNKGEFHCEVPASNHPEVIEHDRLTIRDLIEQRWGKLLDKLFIMIKGGAQQHKQ